MNTVYMRSVYELMVPLKNKKLVTHINKSFFINCYILIFRIILYIF